MKETNHYIILIITHLNLKNQKKQKKQKSIQIPSNPD